MPGQSIGIKFPGPRTTLLQAEVLVWEQEGRYHQQINLYQPAPPEEPSPIVGELRNFLQSAINKLNSK